MLKHFAILAISMNSVIQCDYYLNGRESLLADEYTANITIRTFIISPVIYKKENSNRSKSIDDFLKLPASSWLLNPIMLMNKRVFRFKFRNR